MNHAFKNLYEVRNEVNNIREKMSSIVLTKRKLETELMGYKTKLQTYGKHTNQLLPREEYKKIRARQQKIRDEILLLEKKLLPLKDELRRWCALEDEIKLEAGGLVGVRVESTFVDSPDTINSLIALRNKYMSFSEDSTRISSMRLMASQFVGEITELLEKLSR